MEETTTETFAPIPEPQKGLLLTEEAQYYLKTAAKWGRFLSIIGFVFCGLIAVMGALAGTVLSTVMALAFPGMPASAAFVGFIYIIEAVILFFPCLYLYRFSNNASYGVMFQNKDNVTASLGNLKSLFKFYGILMIVVLSFIALSIVALVIGVSTFTAFKQ